MLRGIEGRQTKKIREEKGSSVRRKYKSVVMKCYLFTIHYILFQSLEINNFYIHI